MVKFKKLLLTTAFMSAFTLSAAQHAYALELSCSTETATGEPTEPPPQTGNTNHVIGGSGGGSNFGSAAGLGGMALSSVAALGAMTFMAGQYSGQTAVYNRQNGGYSDSHVQNQHKLAEETARFEAQQQNEPPRTLCETAAGLAGMAAARDNTDYTTEFTTDVLTGELTNRRGGPTQNGPTAHANTRFATTMALYCDPLSVNTGVDNPCYNERADLIDADINPDKSIYSRSMNLNEDRFDAAVDLTRNVVMPVANQPLSGGVTQTQDGRVIYAMRRSNDARRGMAIEALMGLTAEYQPSTQMGSWVEAMVGGLDGGQFTSEKIVSSVGGSLDSFGGGSALDMIGHFESNGNYNAYYGNAGNEEVDFSQMTIDEVLAWQDQYVADGSPSSAVGKYQFIRGTLRELKESGNYTGDEMFSNDLQDQMATELMNRRGYQEFMNGEISAEQFADNMAKEWASLPMATGPNAGQSYYSGDGLNKALVDLDDYLTQLEAMRGNEGASYARDTSIPSYEVTDTGVSTEEPTVYVSKYKLMSALLAERYMNGTYQLAIAQMNSQSMLLKELNSSASRMNLALFEQYEQNRQLIALTATRLASHIDETVVQTRNNTTPVRILP